MNKLTASARQAHHDFALRDTNYTILRQHLPEVESGESTVKGNLVL